MKMMSSARNFRSSPHITRTVGLIWTLRSNVRLSSATMSIVELRTASSWVRMASRSPFPLLAISQSSHRWQWIAGTTRRLVPLMATSPSCSCQVTLRQKPPRFRRKTLSESTPSLIGSSQIGRRQWYPRCPTGTSFPKRSFACASMPKRRRHPTSQCETSCFAVRRVPARLWAHRLSLLA